MTLVGVYFILCTSGLMSLMILIKCDDMDSLDNIKHVDGWLDPGDMLRYDSATKTMQPEIRSKHSKGQLPSRSMERTNGCDCPQEKVQKQHVQCPKTEFFHFYKRFVRLLLAHFTRELSQMNERPEEIQFDVDMVITQSQLVALKKFVSPEAVGAIQDVDDILTNIIQRVRLHQDFVKMDKSVINWAEFAKENATLLFTVVAGILTIIIFRSLNASRAIVLGMVLLIVVSVVYDGINMYQKLEADKFAERSKIRHVPEHCNPDTASFFRRIGWAVQINILGLDDPCKKYYELNMVDTRFEISPLMVVTTTVGKFVETAAKFSGSAFGLFYRKAMDHFNIVGKIVITLIAVLLSIVVIKYMGLQFLRIFPRLILPERAAPTREMIENLPGDGSPQSQLRHSKKIRTSVTASPTVVPAVCSHCHNQQLVLLPSDEPSPRRSPPREIIITSGDTRVQIKAPQTSGIESIPELQLYMQAPNESDYESSSECPVTPLPLVS